MDEFRRFIIKAKKEGYAAGNDVILREIDQSYTTRFEDGDFSFHDNWFGGEPFGGREVVFLKKKPYWMIVYYGADEGKAPGVIDFLRKALMKIPDDIPVRGPRIFKEGKFRYENKSEGNIEKFTGVEKIYFDGDEVFRTNYAGGLVDQRKDQ
jgi:hypothetical protein